VWQANFLPCKQGAMLGRLSLTITGTYIALKAFDKKKKKSNKARGEKQTKLLKQ
jgi:hypothetical protein